MKHIDSVSASDIPKLCKAQFYNSLRSGRLLFCDGQEDVSKAIEGATKSPWSHILLVWGPIAINEWLTIESTIEKGVHVGLLSDYIEGYDGDLVLCDRVDQAGELVNMATTIDAELRVLDQSYATFGLLENGAHRLIKAIPANYNLTEKYCSGLQQYGATFSSVPFAKTDGAATPEDLWCDPSTQAVCALLKGAK